MHAHEEHRHLRRAATRRRGAAAAALLFAFASGAAASAALAERRQLAPESARLGPDVEATDACQVALVRAGCVVLRVLLVAAGRAGVVNVRLG
jgi:hypothetical protein